MPCTRNNKLQIGLLGAYRLSGRAVTRAPERWPARWTESPARAVIATDAGIDFSYRSAAGKATAAISIIRARPWRR